MKDLQEWAEYYHKYKIYSFPSNINYLHRDWSSQSKAEEIMSSIDWSKAYGLSGVAGVCGTRVIKISISNLDYKMVNAVIESACDMLRLNSRRYPWIIMEFDFAYIIIESSNKVLQGNVYNDYVSLLWGDEFSLPTSNSIAKFYHNSLPLIKVAHTQNDDIFNCINVLNDLLAKANDKTAPIKRTELLNKLSYYAAKSFTDKSKADNLGFTLKEYKRYKSKEEKLLKRFRNRLKIEKGLRRYWYIPLILLVILIMVIATISRTFGKVLAITGLSLFILGFLFIILEEPLNSFVNTFSELKTKKEKIKLILAALGGLLIFITIYGGILLIPYIISELLK